VAKIRKDVEKDLKTDFKDKSWIGMWLTNKEID
jgi:hypothetical protein